MGAVDTWIASERMEGIGVFLDTWIWFDSLAQGQSTFDLLVSMLLVFESWSQKVNSLFLGCVVFWWYPFLGVSKGIQQENHNFRESKLEKGTPKWILQRDTKETQEKQGKTKGNPRNKGNPRFESVPGSSGLRLPAGLCGGERRASAGLLLRAAGAGGERRELVVPRDRWSYGPKWAVCFAKHLRSLRPGVRTNPQTTNPNHQFRFA